MAVGLDEPRQHHAAARVDDRRVGGDLDFGRRSGGDDLVALDDDGRVVNRRHVVAGDQHPADEREVLRRLRARRGGGQQRKDAHARDPTIGKNCHTAPQQAQNSDPN